MITVTKAIVLSESELDLTFIRSPGPGGQNVNKVATAVQLRFDVKHSPSLPEGVRARLLALVASKLTHDGILIIKASRYRTQARNKHDAIKRLKSLIRHAATPIKKRKKTKPTKTSIERRLKQKRTHAKLKALRSKKPDREE